MVLEVATLKLSSVKLLKTARRSLANQKLTWPLSRPSRWKDSVARPLEKKRMVLEVAAAAEGCAPRDSINGLITKPPPMPSIPVRTRLV